MKTIPDAFTHLDDNVYAADMPLNVRDQQIAQGNHNIIMSRRIRRPVMTQAFFSDNASSPMNCTTVDPITSAGGGEAFWRNSIRISPHVQELEVVVRAGRKAVGPDNPDALIYPYLTGPSVRQEIDTSKVMTINAGGEASYRATLEVPTDCFYDRARAGLGYLYFYYSCGVNQTDIKGAAVAITAYGSVNDGYVWFDSTSSFLIGSQVYFSTATIRPRIVRGSESLGGGSYRTYIDGPWEDLPVPNTTTVNSKGVASLYLYSLTAYELETAHFFRI